MKLSNLRRIHVIIIGAVVCVLIGVGMFFLLIKPAKADLNALHQRYSAAEPEALEEDQVRRALDEAIRANSEAQARLDSYMEAKMPSINLSNRAEGMVQLWHEQCETLGPLLERFISRTGVTMVSQRIPVPAPPVNPNDPSLQNEAIVLSLGTIQVQGSFKQVLEHIRKWNNCNRLVMVGAPTLTGQSPTLQASYNITVFIFPREKAGPLIEMAGGAQGAPGTY
jgi:hypothetical protein